jgi:hypothetical protein
MSMTTDDVFGPYPFDEPHHPAGPLAERRGSGPYQVWISGPQDDSLPSLFSALEEDSVVRATRRLVIASITVPVRLIVTWGSDDTPALEFEGLYRCSAQDRDVLLADLLQVFETRPALGHRTGAVVLDGWSDDDFRERVLKALRETARGTFAVSQKAVARMLGTDERTFREECDFRSRRSPYFRWATLKLDALAREG